MQEVRTRSRRASGELPIGEFPPLGVTTHRRLAIEVHDYVRTLILTSVFPPGTVVRIAELARKLGVSRTPMREAFRMLQEEGLIRYEPNQRPVVVGVDIADLDSAYAARVLVESLAVRVSVPALGAEQIAAAEAAFRTMHELRWEHQDSEEWSSAHRGFHAGLMAGADAQLRHQVSAMADRTLPYLRLAQLTDIRMWSEGEAGHEAVLAAVRRGDGDAAARAMAVHLATTAHRVVHEVAPDRRLVAVTAALEMIGIRRDLPAAVRAPLSGS